MTKVNIEILRDEAASIYYLDVTKSYISHEEDGSISPGDKVKEEYKIRISLREIQTLANELNTKVNHMRKITSFP